MKTFRNRISVCFLLLSACSTVSKKESTEALEPQVTSATSFSPEEIEKNAMDSTIDIRYNLGRDHYRFLIQAGISSIEASTSIDRQVLEKGTIHPKFYPGFLNRVAQFVIDYQKQKSLSPNCRNPFQIQLRIGKNTQSVRGCRSNDQGAFSKLVHDGEFLLYSKN